MFRTFTPQSSFLTIKSQVMDTLTPAERGMVMSHVRSKNTRPEILVRRIVSALGYRYRLHRRDLPGTPDLVFPRIRKIIFVHGCFWHRHACFNGRRTPKSRVAFWTSKFIENKRRDHGTRRRLRKMGWDVLVAWECQLRDPAALANRLHLFLKASVGNLKVKTPVKGSVRDRPV